MKSLNVNATESSQCDESYLQGTNQHAGPTMQALLYSNRIQGWIANDSKKKPQRFAVLQLHTEDTRMQKLSPF